MYIPVNFDTTTNNQLIMGEAILLKYEDLASTDKIYLTRDKSVKTRIQAKPKGLIIQLASAKKKNVVESLSSIDEEHEINSRIVTVRTPLQPLSKLEFHNAFTPIFMQVPIKVYPINGKPSEEVDGLTDSDSYKTMLWTVPGLPDNKHPWRLLVKLKNGTYVYFSAWCGRDRGRVTKKCRVYASKKLDTIIKYAMTRSEYLAYIKDTVPSKHR